MNDGVNDGVNDADRLPFWEDPEIVERFAARPPDVRMQELLLARDPARAPARTRVLDLGCAGGRNTVWLAEHGFDVHALDASQAMVARTRERLTPLLGRAEAERRVRRGRMDDLSPFADGSFDLVLAFGIYHGARSEAEWHRAVAETARVLRPGGELLVAHFTPDSDPTGEGLEPVRGEQHLYRGFTSQRKLLLLEPDELDAWMARHGFLPVTPSTAVRVEQGRGHRTTVNAHYRKRS